MIGWMITKRTIHRYILIPGGSNSLYTGFFLKNKANWPFPVLSRTFRLNIIAALFDVANGLLLRVR